MRILISLLCSIIRMFAEFLGYMFLILFGLYYVIQPAPLTSSIMVAVWLIAVLLMILVRILEGIE